MCHSFLSHFKVSRFPNKVRCETCLWRWLKFCGKLEIKLKEMCVVLMWITIFGWKALFSEKRCFLKHHVKSIKKFLLAVQVRLILKLTFFSILHVCWKEAKSYITHDVTNNDYDSHWDNGFIGAEFFSNDSLWFLI